MQELFLRNLWSDGLPIVPPTIDRVERFVEHARRGVLPPDSATSDDPDRPVRVFIRPEWIGIVAGDPGRNQSKGYCNNHIQGGRVSMRIEA